MSFNDQCPYCKSDNIELRETKFDVKKLEVSTRYACVACLNWIDVNWTVSSPVMLTKDVNPRARYEMSDEQITDFAINTGFVEGKILHFRHSDLVKAFFSISEQAKVENIENIFNFANNHLEVWDALVLITLCIEANEQIQHTKSYVEFIKKHKEMLTL
jgi:hypothetical protein